MKTTYSLQCTDATLRTSINLQGIWIIPTFPQRVISVDASLPNFWVAWFLFCLATPLPFSKLPKTFCSDPHPHLHEWWWVGSSLEAIIVTWGIWIRLQSHYFWILIFSTFTKSWWCLCCAYLHMADFNRTRHRRYVWYSTSMLPTASHLIWGQAG